MPKLYPGYREEIRKKIVDEAFTVFMEKGFEKTTMDDIAARLGVTKPAIYRYYKNKEELFLSSVTESMAAEFRKIFEISFTHGDLMTGAGRFFDELLAFDRKYAAIRRDMDGITARNPETDEGISRIHMDGMELMSQFLREHKKKGTIHSTIDDTALTIMLSALAHGLTSNVGYGLKGEDAKKLWLAGMGKILEIRDNVKK